MADPDPETPRSFRPAAHGASGRGLVPWVLLLPAVLLMAGVLALRLRGGASGPGVEVAPPGSPPEGMEGWSGRRADEGGAELRVTLAPLHADPAQQAFDARALASRLGLPEGQPWRLVLEGGGPEPEARPSVVDRLGGRLVPLLERAGSGGARPDDPLRSLFLPPDGSQGVWVLWGPVLGDGVRLEGLGRPLPLVSTSIRTADLGAAMLRVAQRGEEPR